MIEIKKEEKKVGKSVIIPGSDGKGQTQMCILESGVGIGKEYVV